MKDKTKVAIAALGLTALVGGAGVAYAKNSEEIRVGIVDKIYETLPEQTQNEYAAEVFLESDYFTRSTVVKNMLYEDQFTREDTAVIGVQSMMNLENEDRALTLELVLDKSDYEVTKDVTMYGIPKLTAEDAGQAAVESGRNLWNNFTQKVEETYNNLLQQYGQ